MPPTSPTHPTTAWWNALMAVRVDEHEANEQRHRAAGRLFLLVLVLIGLSQPWVKANLGIDSDAFLSWWTMLPTLGGEGMLDPAAPPMIVGAVMVVLLLVVAATELSVVFGRSRSTRLTGFLLGLGMTVTALVLIVLLRAQSPVVDDEWHAWDWAVLGLGPALTVLGSLAYTLAFAVAERPLAWLPRPPEAPLD